jgi:protein involved in polysaccharide export with SLBB domain
VSKACPPLVRSLQVGLALLVSCSAVTLALGQERTVQSADRADVVVRPGDRVRLKVWREPDLSGEFVVDEAGTVVLPSIGPIEVQRLSTDSLKALLVARYSASLRNPAVEVTVLRRVNVLGAVRNPGVYHVDLTNTVADVLALAGGVSSEGNQNRIELVRGGKRQPVRLSGDSRLAESPILSGDQLLVAERGWFERNTGLIAAGVTGTALIFAALIR